MAQQLWKAFGLYKPTVLSVSSISRTFSSFHPFNNSSDPAKEKARLEKQAEYHRRKRRTDAEWALARQRTHSKSRAKQRANLTEEQYQQYLLHNRQVRNKLYAEDPARRLRLTIGDVVRRHDWVRERLPWKTHTPVVYQEKVQHTCSTCLIPRYGGVAKLWWASHDGEHYQCNACYFKNSDFMPKGYEDITSRAELRKRRDELGH